MKIAAIVPLLALVVSAPLQGSGPAVRVLREERTVSVGGVEETWRLEWRTKPAPACGPERGETGDWTTCPCAGFEFGESGELDLVRTRPDAPDERLPLALLFADGEAPVPGAVLPRWPLQKGDEKAAASTGFAAAVRKRPPVSILKLADYDHDGQATEFVLQVSAGPCGHRPSILVGLDPRGNNLRAFTAVEDPASPLVLECPSDWEKVRQARGRVSLVRYGCGDHGTEVEESVTVWTDAKGLHARRSTKACPP
jgi:hypothetical protein